MEIRFNPYYTQQNYQQVDEKKDTPLSDNEKSADPYDLDVQIKAKDPSDMPPVKQLTTWGCLTADCIHVTTDCPTAEQGCL